MVIATGTDWQRAAQCLLVDLCNSFELRDSNEALETRILHAREAGFIWQCDFIAHRKEDAAVGIICRWTSREKMGRTVGTGEQGWTLEKSGGSVVRAVIEPVANFKTMMAERSYVALLKIDLRTGIPDFVDELSEWLEHAVGEG